jgi:hypothetical protein
MVLRDFHKLSGGADFEVVRIENKELIGQNPLRSEAGPFFAVESVSHLDFIMTDGAKKPGMGQPAETGVRDWLGRV